MADIKPHSKYFALGVGTRMVFLTENNCQDDVRFSQVKITGRGEGGKKKKIKYISIFLVNFSTCVLILISKGLPSQHYLGTSIYAVYLIVS